MTGADLTGRRVLLTGASRGVGRAVARRLVRAGADVIGTARDEQLLDEVARAATDGPGSFVPAVADLTDPATPGRLADVVDQRWGALDVLVNNAGVMLARDERFEDEPAGTLEETLAVNALDPGWVRTSLGGDQAPGRVEESAFGAMALLAEPTSVTGRFFKDGIEIPF
jgi:NAD(P)-dependent dehydrogenase (short-subunit alcohol dehydrogenase family)